MNAQLQYDLLAAWETGLDQGPCRRALGLLCAATGKEAAAVEGMSFGERDRTLLSLRERLFGPQLHAIHACPACGSLQEFDLSVQSLRLDGLPEASVAGSVLELSADGFDVRFRVPVLADALALEAALEMEPDVPIEDALLERCLVKADREGSLAVVADLPSTVRSAISARMADADPQAEINLAFECCDCAAPWTELFDVAGYLWEEVQAWALRTFHEVHCLASAYGWSEHEVLAVSPRRRSLYLERIAEFA